MEGVCNLKLNGTFALREIAGEVLAIPIGDTALSLNGMIVLNPVSKVIWECLERGESRDAILAALTDTFDVEETVAREDMESFLCELEKQNLITGTW